MPARLPFCCAAAKILLWSGVADSGELQHVARSTVRPLPIIIAAAFFQLAGRFIAKIELFEKSQKDASQCPPSGFSFDLVNSLQPCRSVMAFSHCLAFLQKSLPVEKSP
ncbi:MAG: hypothetical protein ABIG35_19160 [Pseudomonadota bacterium]